MTKPTYAQIARDFSLWQEYADTYGVMTRDEFQAQPPEERELLLLQCFGPEVPTIEAVLEGCRESNGLYGWDEEGGRVMVTADVLVPALEEAYDSTMPEWPTLVQLS